MRKAITIVVLLVAFAAAVMAQKEAGASAPAQGGFPGISASHLAQLKYAKTRLMFPLPTWIPPGFSLEKIEMNLGSDVDIEDKQFVVIYSKPLGRNKAQKFAIETGFDGLGDLPYETTLVTSPIGKIGLAYQPVDPDTGKRLPGYSRTDWFGIGGKFSYAYDGMYGDEEVVMISRADTVKIIQSLKRF